MTNAAAELLASKPNVLLDFDGPVCSVFGGVGADTVARELRERLGLSEQHSADVRDPFEILRYAAREGHREATAAERELTRLEMEAVASATPTPGAVELFHLLADRNQATVIVSNNSEAAVRRYLHNQGLTELVRGISARIDPNPALLKPSAHLLFQALTTLGAEADQCVMVGDSLADIEAAYAAAIPAIAYANKPGKFEQLGYPQHEVVIRRMADLLSLA